MLIENEWIKEIEDTSIQSETSQIIDLNGKPLLYYVITASQKSNVNEIITNDKYYEQHCKKIKIGCPFECI